MELLIIHSMNHFMMDDGCKEYFRLIYDLVRDEKRRIPFFNGSEYA